MCRTLLESRLDGPTPSALNSPGGIRDESILGLAPVKPALNDLPSPSSGDYSVVSFHIITVYCFYCLV